MTNKQLLNCITFICFIIVVFTIMGSILYIHNCDTYFTNQCISKPISCKINDHYIYDTTCYDDDDDINSYNCYDLTIKCVDNNYICYATVSYFYSYLDALNYFQEHYYHNETIPAYILDNNQTCTLINPIPNSAIAIFGFYSIIFAIILFIILFVFVFVCISYKKNNKNSNELNNQSLINELPKYTLIDSPPKYQ
jgi:hypothetical protein